MLDRREKGAGVLTDYAMPERRASIIAVERRVDPLRVLMGGGGAGGGAEVENIKTEL